MENNYPSILHFLSIVLLVNRAEEIMQKAILIIILLCFALLSSIKICEVKGWLAGFDYRVRIEIDSGDIDANLTNFPVLLYLSNSSSGIYNEDVSFIFDEIGNNSLKIAVTVGTDQQTFVEIEKWDYPLELAWLWANVTASSLENSTLYLYYDKDVANNTDYVDFTNTGNSTWVWDSTFEYVYHMRDNTTASVVDSSNAGNDGAKFAANQPIVTLTGQIDDCQDFDGVNDFIDNPANIPQVYTVEAWITKDADVTRFFHGGQFNRYAALIGYDAATNDFYAVKSQWDAYIHTDAVALGTFYYITYVVNTTFHEIFRDGVSRQSANTAFAAQIDANLYIGRRNDAFWWDGLIDEIRLSNTVRSGSYINASYQSGLDDLLDWGVQELIAYYIDYFQNVGGIFRVNNVTIANNTQQNYTFGEFIEIIAIVEGNHTYGFNNFTYDSSISILNPYNFTVSSNLTIWTYFLPWVAADDADMTIGFVFGIIALVLALTVYVKKRES